MDAKVGNDNQTTPANADNDGKAVENSSTTGVDGQTNSTNTAPTSVQAAPVFDPQKSFEALKGDYDKVNKSYSELRKEFTRRTQYEAELQKKMDTMLENLSKATETPIDPEAFIRDLRVHGPKALEPHFQKWMEPKVKEYEQKLSEREGELLNLRVEREIDKRERDAASYPDFEKLKPLMNEIANSDDCPVNWAMGVDKCLDTLYKLAKDRSAETAIQAAVKIGEKKAEEKLAKEAKVAVAGGGKSAGSAVPDLNNISDINKLREVVAGLHGIADRD